MSQKTLSEFQHTLEELKKLGSFDPEEIQWLSDMDKSLSEIAKEMHPERSPLPFTNTSGHPDPLFSEGQLILKAFLPGDLLLAPLQAGAIPTGIRFFPPEGIHSFIQPIARWSQQGLWLSESTGPQGEILLLAFNAGPRPVVVKNGEDLTGLFFTYTVSETTMALKKI